MGLAIPAEGGVLGVLKPPGMTSHDVVRACRQLLATRDIGHAGTLDPVAAGVLPLVFGPATRLSESLSWPQKAYRAEVVFGVRTDTGDLAGTVQADEIPATEPGMQQLASAVAALTGRQDQAPPAYSARRVDGKRLYDLARAGLVEDRHLQQATREIEVHSIEILWQGRLGWGRYSEYPAALLDIACSSGTYIRQLAERVGSLLGYPATLAFLVRSRCAGFGLDECVEMEGLSAPSGQSADERFPHAWRRPAQAVGFLPSLIADPAATQSVIHGLRLPLDAFRIAEGPDGYGAVRQAPGCGGGRFGLVSEGAVGWVTVVDATARLIALAQVVPGHGEGAPTVHPKRVFVQ
jgi:tRNA pseudouridine55 synthase